MSKIKGKQFEDSTITQDKIGITTDTVVSESNATTVEYVDTIITSGASNLVYSTNNVDMVASITSGNTPILATSTQVIDTPHGGIKVFVNGIEVNNGIDLDCFFAPEATGTPTPRSYGSEQQNDYLWWNPSVAPYQLDNQDSITFTYLIYTSI